jgi:hypothetical protein
MGEDGAKKLHLGRLMNKFKVSVNIESAFKRCEVCLEDCVLECDPNLYISIALSV